MGRRASIASVCLVLLCACADSVEELERQPDVVPERGSVWLTQGWLCAAIDGVLACYEGNPNGVPFLYFGPLDVGRRIVGMPRVRTVAATEFGAICALDQDGQPWCVGDNSGLQLGFATQIDSEPYPQPLFSEVPMMAQTSGLQSIEAGAGHFCGLSSDGQAVCWGGTYAACFGRWC